MSPVSTSSVRPGRDRADRATGRSLFSRGSGRERSPAAGSGPVGWGVVLEAVVPERPASAVGPAPLGSRPGADPRGLDGAWRGCRQERPGSTGAPQGLGAGSTVRGRWSVGRRLHPGDRHAVPAGHLAGSGLEHGSSRRRGPRRPTRAGRWSCTTSGAGLEAPQRLLALALHAPALTARSEQEEGEEHQDEQQAAVPVSHGAGPSSGLGDGLAGTATAGWAWTPVRGVARPRQANGHRSCPVPADGVANGECTASARRHEQRAPGARRRPERVAASRCVRRQARRAAHGCRRRGRAQPEVRPGRGGGDPAARRADQQALAHEERLGDRLDGLGLLAHGHGERREARPGRRRTACTAPRGRRGRAGRGRARRPRRRPSAARAAASVDDAVARAPGPSRAPGAAAGWRSAGCRASGRRSRGRRRRSSSTPSSPAERCSTRSSSAGLVEVQVAGEAEPVAQRARAAGRPGWSRRRG